MVSKITLNILVSVVISKEIIEPPHSVGVLQGSPVTLDCRTSISADGIIWYKDGSVVGTEDVQDRFLILPDGSLFFLSTEVKDSGNYHCNVVTWNGVEESKTAKLTVTEQNQFYSLKDDSAHDTYSKPNQSLEQIQKELEGDPKYDQIYQVDM